jgi:hypothetical protein
MEPKGSQQQSCAVLLYQKRRKLSQQDATWTFGSGNVGTDASNCLSLPGHLSCNYGRAIGSLPHTSPTSFPNLLFLNKFTKDQNPIRHGKNMGYGILMAQVLEQSASVV